MSKAFERSMEDAVQAGEKKGLKNAAALMNFLWSNGRSDDAIKAGNDEDYLNQLLNDFNSGVLTAN